MRSIVQDVLTIFLCWESEDQTGRDWNLTPYLIESAIKIASPSDE